MAQGLGRECRGRRGAHVAAGGGQQAVGTALPAAAARCSRLVLTLAQLTIDPVLARSANAGTRPPPAPCHTTPALHNPPALQVGSRYFGFHRESNETLASHLVPLIDLLNHSEDPNAERSGGCPWVAACLRIAARCSTGDAGTRGQLH